jgi:hypothetical protein
MLRALTVAYGLLFLILGFAGHHTMPAQPDTHEWFGAFPVNGLHNIVHVAIGIAGLAAGSVGTTACRVFGKAVGMGSVALAVLGVVSPTGFGVMPIGGTLIPLHLAAGASALYFGFSRRFAPRSDRLLDLAYPVPRRNLQPERLER